MDRIHIFDTTLRDGEQVPGSRLNTEEKLLIAKHLDDMGVDVIEAGFPISSPGDFESVKQIASTVKNATVCALSRAIEGDIDSAGKAIARASKPRIHTGIGTSDQHIYTKIKSTPEKIIEIGKRAVKAAKKYVEDVEFYAEDAGRTKNEFLAKVVEAAIAGGATVINVPDTLGYCLPDEYGEKIKYLFENVKHIERVIVSTHCHNDLGLATANSIEGIRNGARQIECTINGVGERAGNTSLEEVVMIIKKRKHLNFETNINTHRLNFLSQLVSKKMNIPVQPNKAIVGGNAFAHSSGIHQDGFLKNNENYEIINPEEVGVKQSLIVLTARSGRAALNYRLQKLNIDLEKEELNRVYKKFLALADTKEIVDDDDLAALASL